MFLKKNFLKSSSYIVFTIFVIFFICFIHTYTFGKIFKIQDIEIEEPFNSNFNKEKVINKAFGEAFDTLLNSLITSNDKNKIKNTQLKDIKYLIDSFTITNEQFLNKNYQANFEVNFDKPKILNFFEKKNIFPSMYKKKEFLTLLILIDNDEDKVLLFDRNPFYTKWNDDTKNFSQINYVLHEEDILDLKFINENKDIIENFKFDQIVKKYDTEDYIVAIYFKNKNNLRVLSKMFYEGKVKISNQSYKKVDISDDLQLLNIIEKTKIFFEDIWKQNNQINTSIKLPINISINSKKVKQIQLIENYLAQLDLVSNFYVTSFNNNNTIYKIIFNGNPNQFLTLMKEKDIDIDTNQEIWKVR